MVWPEQSQESGNKYYTPKEKAHCPQMDLALKEAEDKIIKKLYCAGFNRLKCFYWINF